MDKSFLFQILLSGFISGIIIFQTALAAPIVFTHLKEDQSRIFIRKIFPRLFLLLYITGIVMLICNFIFDVVNDSQIWVSIITIVLPFICSLMVKPINNATDNNEHKKFKVLHSISVILTMLVLIINIFWCFF